MSESRGILASLRHAPEALAALDEAKRWRSSFAAFARPWMVEDLDFDGRVAKAIERPQTITLDKRTPAQVQLHYEGLQRHLAQLLEQVRASLDPHLFDGSRSAEEAYPVLCRLGQGFLRRTLDEVYGITLAGATDYDALCDGVRDLDTLQQKARAAAKRGPGGTTPRTSGPRKPPMSKTRKSFRITFKRRAALIIAGNAWVEEPGSSTNFNGASEARVARELIDAGYLEKTGQGTFAGQIELNARLTNKGRNWLIDNAGAAYTEENYAQLRKRGTSGGAKTPPEEGLTLATKASPEKAAAKKPAAKKPAAKKPAAKKASPEKPAAKKAAKKTAKKKAAKKASKKASPEKPAAKKAAKKKASAKKKPATKKRSAKKASTKKASAKKASAKKASAKKPATKKRPTKKPPWRYTVHADVRHRFRELDGVFVVERDKNNVWVAATQSAAKAIHDKTNSACALAARILPTCGNAKRPVHRPSAAEKENMRRLLGL